MAVPYVLHRLPHRVAAGSWNMAADRSLLAWVSSHPSRLAFRTYGWERPTLSLGRSEPWPGGWDEEALARAGVEVARRPTGGNAVLHLEEVTFALAAALPGPWRLTPRGFANAAAEALAAALQSCGLAGARIEEERPERAPAREVRALCFARSAPGEVSARGYKVAGIASRFDRAGALCHASLPLTARSRSIAGFRLDGGAEVAALERNARSVGELLAGGGSREALEGRVEEALADAFAARFRGAWTELSFADAGLEACEPATSR